MAEKTSANINPRANDFYQKALAALERKNYDYAIEMLIQTLNVEPNFIKARQILRATQMKLTESAGSFKRMFSAAKLTPLLTKAKVAVQKNPSEAMSLAEQALTADPKNGTALNILAEAAEVAKFPETVVQTLETCIRLNPRDTKTLHWLARAYDEIGMHVQSRETYEKLLEINPNDFEAQKGAKDAEAHGAMADSGLEGAASFRDALKDKDESVALEQKSRIVRAEDMVDNLINEKLEALGKEPDNPVIQRDLAKLYVQRENFDEALRYLEALNAKEGGTDPSLEREIADAKVKRLEAQIQARRKQIEKSPASAVALENEAADLQKQLDTLKLAEAERLVERYPNDLMYRFDLGVLYHKAGNVQGAVEQFQKSRGQPQRRVQSLNYLGQCFQTMDLADMAVDVYNEAIAEIPVMDGLKKDLIYNLGCAYELMGEQDKAIAEFKKIASVDFGYRDVRDKVMRKRPPQNT